MKTIYCILFVVLTACSTTKVLDTESAAGVDMSSYKTFDFYRVNASGDTVSALFNMRVTMLKETIGSELVKRGYVQNSSNPDLLINIGILVKEQVQTRTTDWLQDGAPRYVGQRNYTWRSEEIETGRYRDGTVSLHFVDAAQKKLVWKGAVRGTIPQKREAAEIAMQRSMQKLFERFPVR